MDPVVTLAGHDGFDLAEKEGLRFFVALLVATDTKGGREVSGLDLTVVLTMVQAVAGCCVCES